MPVSMLSTSLITNPRKYGRFNALDTIYKPPTDSFPGMVLVKPTSITHSGTSATVGANGQVTFTAITSLSLNGVFSADFDNYMVSICGIIATSGAAINARYRSSGTDASGSNYARQLMEVADTIVTANRSTGQTSHPFMGMNNASQQGAYVMIYGPYLAQPTAYRNVGVHSFSGAYMQEYAGTHSLSTSYDGFTIFPGSNNITGALQVYGVRS
jgi:hypothetical protein